MLSKFIKKQKKTQCRNKSYTEIYYNNNTHNTLRKNTYTPPHTHTISAH